MMSEIKMICWKISSCSFLSGFCTTHFFFAWEYFNNVIFTISTSWSYKLRNRIGAPLLLSHFGKGVSENCPINLHPLHSPFPSLTPRLRVAVTETQMQGRKSVTDCKGSWEGWRVSCVADICWYTYAETSFMFLLMTFKLNFCHFPLTKINE